MLVSMFSIGMMVGGIAPDAKTAGVIASLLYFPMLIFSGATLPYEVMPGPLRQAAGLLPLTQGIKLLKAASLGLPAESVRLPILLMAAIAGVCAPLLQVGIRAVNPGPSRCRSTRSAGCPAVSPRRWAWPHGRSCPPP